MEHNDILNKLIILAICIVFGVSFSFTFTSVVPIIAALIAAGVASYLDQPNTRHLIMLIYGAISLVFTGMVFYLPLIVYTCAQESYSYYLLALLPAIAATSLPTSSRAALSGIIILSILVKKASSNSDKLKKKLLSAKDNAKEIELLMNKGRLELLEKQDDEIRIATLNERNRIAREMHDSIGHQLSRAILQVGALISISKDGSTKEGLHQIKDTLNQSMNSIRNSIHGLYDTSIDLNDHLEMLCTDFSKCEVSLKTNTYTKPDSKIKFAIIAILKEALSNTAKHSNASHMKVSLIEHPGFFQLLISDNGTGPFNIDTGGIGLESMKKRVEILKGHMSINANNGFSIFVSLPKEETI